MNRRGFLTSILAAGAAPVIVRAASLMPIKAPAIWTPPADVLTVDAMRKMAAHMSQHAFPVRNGRYIVYAEPTPEIVRHWSEAVFAALPATVQAGLFSKS